MQAGQVLWAPSASASNLSADLSLQLLDASFITPIERPFLHALTADQACVRKDAEVLTGGRLADAQLSGDQQPTNAVRLEVSIDLRREMLSRILEPFQDSQAIRIRESTQPRLQLHIDV